MIKRKTVTKAAWIVIVSLVIVSMFATGASI